MLKKQILLLSVLCAGLALPGALLSASSARAVAMGFGCLTNNLAADCAIGEAQLSVDVTDLGGGQVRFEFANAGPLPSVISEIYFDNGTLLGISVIDDSLPGVDFEALDEKVSPKNLPGADQASPPFEVTEGFATEPESPAETNGVGPSEWVAIIVDLQPGGTFADVVEELGNGDLRIGIHVSSFSSGGGESFLNAHAPEPGTALLLALGLLGLAALRRAR